MLISAPSLIIVRHETVCRCTLTGVRRGGGLLYITLNLRPSVCRARQGDKKLVANKLLPSSCFGEVGGHGDLNKNKLKCKQDCVELGTISLAREEVSYLSQ